ncbi:MAG: hypothetical protein J2P15_00505 [Micromonosporaceae bacterium]|nr:hypothetical protein [Micromonosporaceae bacterium]
MLVDIRPDAKMRGEKAVDVVASLGPVVEALREDTVDLSRVRLVCDWIQYRNNFRTVVDARPILSAEPPDGLLDDGNLAQTDEGDLAQTKADHLELALDIRRCGELPGTDQSGGLPLKELTARVLREHADPAAQQRLALEPWQRTSGSLLWDFNALYWRALELWEEATGQRYEQALPGGESDARNRGAVRAMIGELFDLWDSLAARNALPDELFVVELGVGNGNQAKVWLEEFARLDREHGTEYYRRLHYLMCDYSPHVLERARTAVTEHGEHVSSLVLDATQPMTALAFLRYKVFLVYISNVYDNLPTDEITQIGGRTYVVQSRAYLAADDAQRLATSVGAQTSALPGLIGKLLKLGPAMLAEAAPAHLRDAAAAVEFWRSTWDALRLAERYVPLTDLDLYLVAPTVSGETVRPLLENSAGIRMQVSNGAAASFVSTLPLLHPFGRLVCHDLFVTDVQAFRTGFRGPGKYDGSVVNWVNGPLLAYIGRRKGFDVSYAPFAHRTGTNIVTMTAQVRE